MYNITESSNVRQNVIDKSEMFHNYAKFCAIIHLTQQNVIIMIEWGIEMKFKNRLNDYILQANCSSKELALASGLSEGTISRYRKGYRVPGLESEHLRNLAAGLYAILSRTDSEISEAEIYASLRQTVDKGLPISLDAYISKLKQLLRTCESSNNELGRKLNYDPSYISRILSGQRRPADIRKFTTNVASYIAHQKAEEIACDPLMELLGCTQQDISSSDTLQDEIFKWLSSD